MRILITNDDGIESEGIRALVDWAQKLGEVSVFAPNVEQSGKSVSVQLREAFKVEKVEYPGAVEAYAVHSTPADCVRFAVLGLGKKFDLVLSGVNKGQNLGHDINYSGTAGAVIEAGMHGIKGIAVSTSKKGLPTAVANFDKVYVGNFDADKFAVGSLHLPEGEKMDDFNRFEERMNNLIIFQAALEAFFNKFIETLFADDIADTQEKIQQWVLERDSK